jgi:hypothetical protein
MPRKTVKDKVDEMLRKRGAGRMCKRHPRRPVSLGFIWADGRASGFACDRQCFLDWEESQGKWACVVRVIPVNRL